MTSPGVANRVHIDRQSWSFFTGLVILLLRIVDVITSGFQCS